MWRDKYHVDKLLIQANAEIDAGRFRRALDHLWEALRIHPGNAHLRANVIRVGTRLQLERGHRALRRGDTSSLYDLERQANALTELVYEGLNSVTDQGYLVLRAHDLQAVVADLRELQRQRKLAAPPPPIEDFTVLLAEHERMERYTGPLRLTMEWAIGNDPREYIFGVDSRITRDLQASTHGRLIRYYLYSKYHNRPRNGDSYTNHPASFGLIGLFTTRTLSEQFVGRFRIDAEVIGRQIRYTATNTTSFTSATYIGRLPNWETHEFSPMSNMRQTYVWWEPLQRWPASR